MSDRRKFLKLMAPTLLLPSRELILPDAKAQWSNCGAGFCNNGAASSGLTIDAIGTVQSSASANTLSINMTVGPSANAMLIACSFGYSPHTSYTLTWTVGITTQTLTPAPGSTFDFLYTVDNGAAAPAFALQGLLHPTPGAGTLTMTFAGAADSIIMSAVSFNNVNTNGGLSRAFTSAFFTTQTSNSSSIIVPSVPNSSIQMAFIAGVSSTPTTWNTGTTLYSTITGGTTWGAGVYKTGTSATTFTMGINASVQNCICAVLVNPANALPVGSATINGANSIASGLTAAIPCYNSTLLTDLISLNTAAPAGCSTDTSGGYNGGLAVPGGSTTAKADFGVFQPVPQGDFTILAVANPTSSANQNALVGQSDTTPNNFVDILMNSNDVNATNAGFAAGTTFTPSRGADDNPSAFSGGTRHQALIDGGYHTWGFRNSALTPSIWCDGTNVTASTAALSGTWTNGSQHFAVGNLGNYTGSAFSANCTVILVLVWNRALSDAEIGSITSNPFQVLH